MFTPLPHQLEGAAFLSSQKAALLADAPRVGKTGSALRATDLLNAESILVITTSSGVAVWKQAFEDWCHIKRDAVIAIKHYTSAQMHNVLIVSWAQLSSLKKDLIKRFWDILIVDEAHYAANIVSSDGIPVQCTMALYGNNGLANYAEYVWLLTGTPIPNGSPLALYPLLRCLAPQRLRPYTKYEDFKKRYCVTKTRFLNGRKVETVVNGCHLEELNQRLNGMWLRRNQKDVGIQPPFYNTLPLTISAAQRVAIEDQIPDASQIIVAAEQGNTEALELQMGPLRRLTARIKARLVAQALKEEFECGLDKIVLMAWHHDALDELQIQLKQYNPVRVDGSVPAIERGRRIALFQHDKNINVFLGQMQSCGEAVDLSVAANLIFVELSFSPKDMTQASLRITNHNQKRQCLVRVASLAGSIDDACARVLVRKVSINNQLMETKNANRTKNLWQ